LFKHYKTAIETEFLGGVIENIVWVNVKRHVYYTVYKLTNNYVLVLASTLVRYMQKLYG